MSNINGAMAQAAQALYDEARQHKQASAYHRKRAKACMQSLAELRATCAEFGIRLNIGSGDTDHG